MATESTGFTALILPCFSMVLQELDACRKYGSVRAALCAGQCPESPWPSKRQKTDQPQRSFKAPTAEYARVGKIR